MTATISPLTDDVYTVLRTFLLSVVPAGTEIIQGLGNRTPPPLGSFIAMTAISRARLSTNVHTYSDPFPTPGGSDSIQMSTRLQIQLDCYGADSGDTATLITTLLRDEVACEALAPTCAPLYADDPRMSPLISGEEQYIERWTVGAELQYNPVTVVSQDFAASLELDLINVDEAYPP